MASRKGDLMDVKCSECKAKTAILEPSEDDLAQGITWLCDSCSATNHIEGAQ